MVYLANWGSRRLMFRFHSSALDLNEIEPYCQPLIIEDHISVSTAGEFRVLDIAFYPEGCYDRTEGEGWLPAMLPLRQDIMRGDYRALYLAWLRAMEFEDVLESVQEPPVPPGLKDLSPALHRFIGFFGLDEVLVQVAAEASPPQRRTTENWMRQALSKLDAWERDDFLLRLAQGESGLSGRLHQRLRKVLPPPEPQSLPRRTVGEIRRATAAQREAQRRRKAREEEARRVRELESLAERESETWDEVYSLIEETQVKAYDKAVDLLAKLRDLAAYRGRETVFQQLLDRIYEQYSRRPALLRRLREAGLERSEKGD
jgi:hypothetical protein